MTDTGAPDLASASARAVAIAELVAVDPAGLGGVVVRAGAGPVRDRWLALLVSLLPAGAPVRRVPCHIADDRLIGGLDLAATLAAGRPVAQTGVLAAADGGLAVLAMAERLAGATAARIAAALDQGRVEIQRDGLALAYSARFAAVALDEGMEADDAVPTVLADRLALRLALDAIPLGEADAFVAGAGRVTAARGRLPAVAIGGPMVELLVQAALALGVPSLRATLHAVAAARAAAALAGRDAVADVDAETAIALVLAQRATCLPEAPPAEEAQPPPPEQRADDASMDDRDAADRPLEERVLDAVRAVLPPDILAALAAPLRDRTRTPAAGASGAERTSPLRGRPLPPGRGEPRGGHRLDLVATLRAAAPWQTLRRAARPPVAGAPRRIEVRHDDFRIRRFRRNAQSTTIFAVDASGSTALNRLAEAKGAVELLLADCYVRRDSVALVAFRREAADVLLPATRSLVRAKRCLAGLPGGGATPLASGIEAARHVADGARRKGETAFVVLVTDGRANVGNGGRKGRATAEADALAQARTLSASGARAILIDVSPRSEPFARTLSDAMAARYVSLPHAGSVEMSEAVRREQGR